jgi:hypothetical protein
LTRRPGSTSRECWLGFSILTILFVGAVLGILLRLQPIETELSDMENARTRAHAAQELEVHVLGYALGIHRFLAVANRGARQAIVEDAREVRNAIAEYGRVAVSQHHGAMVTRLSSLWSEFESAGEALIATAAATPNVAPQRSAGNDAPDPPPGGDEQVIRFDDRLLGLERFVEDELQRDGDEDYRARLQGTVRQGSDIEGFALITLLVGTAVALLTTVTVGRAVRTSERQGLDARQFADDIVEAMRQPLLVLDGELRRCGPIAPSIRRSTPFPGTLRAGLSTSLATVSGMFRASMRNSWQCWRDTRTCTISSWSPTFLESASESCGSTPAVFRGLLVTPSCC